MKITVNQLRRIIKEEVSRVLREADEGRGISANTVPEVLAVLNTLPLFSENPPSKDGEDYTEVAKQIATMKKTIAREGSDYDPREWGTFEMPLFGTPLEGRQEEVADAIVANFFPADQVWGSM